MLTSAMPTMMEKITTGHRGGKAFHHAAGVHQAADPEANGGGERGGDHEETGDPQTQLAQLFQVLTGGQAAHHRGNDQRDDDHLDGSQEQLPGKRQPVTDQGAGIRLHKAHRRPEQSSHYQPQEHADQNREPEAAFDEPGEVGVQVA